MNNNIYDNLNSQLYNQDNNGVWVNPILQKTSFKIFLLIFYIFMGYAFLCNVDFEKITSKQIIFHSIYIIILVLSLFLLIKNKIQTKIFVKNQEKIAKENIDTNFNYYRDILNEYSPGVLAFCYNKNLKYEDIIISVLLSLKDKYIDLDIQNKNIKIFEKEISNDLKEHEKYLLENVKEISNSNINFKDLKKMITDTYFKSNFLNLIKKDCKESNYFRTEYNYKPWITYLLLIDFLVLFISAFMTRCIDVMFVGFSSLLMMAYIIYLDSKNSYIMTTQGCELSSKLNGLKKYILDFSMIKDRGIKDIALWDYYIIYAIILDLKGNLDKEVSNLYKEIS